MKEIRMDYSEYEKMVQIIKTQQETIEEFKKESRVVLVDERFDSNTKLSWFNNGCPKVIADEKLAKEYLQKEFDNLSKYLIRARESLDRLYTERELMNKKKKSSWWRF